MNEFHIYVMCAEERSWLLQGFAYLINRYLSPLQWVSVVGDRNVKLPNNFAYYPNHSILYSNRLIELLKSMDEKYFILMNEDNWLRGRIDLDAIKRIHEWLNRMDAIGRNILRFDLLGNIHRYPTTRKWRGMNPPGFELSYSPPGSGGLMKFSPSIWNRELLIQLLQPDETRLQAEDGGEMMMISHCPGAIVSAQSNILDCVSVCQNGSTRVNPLGFDVSVVNWLRHRRFLWRIER